MEKSVKSKLFILVKIVLFYAIAIYIGQMALREYVVWPVIHWIYHVYPGLKHEIYAFTQLDYGRIVGRISGFVGVFAIYFLFIKLIDKVPLTKSALFPGTSKLKYFIYGVILGGVLVSITIAITLLSKTIILQPATNWMAALLPTIILYLCIQLITATTEELIFRGYILNNLLEIINPHIAVIGSSLLFSYIHLQYSFLYASQAFLFALIVGYGYIWSRNLYFCIGIHFAWNFMESVIYSHSLFNVVVANPFLGGDKNITPDREGLFSLPALIIGILTIFYCRNLLRGEKENSKTR